MVKVSDNVACMHSFLKVTEFQENVQKCQVILKNFQMIRMIFFKFLFIDFLWMKFILSLIVVAIAGSITVLHGCACQSTRETPKHFSAGSNHSTKK